jgi:hypothetical protein
VRSRQKRRKLTISSNGTENSQRWTDEKWVVCRYGVGAGIGLGIDARVGDGVRCFKEDWSWCTRWCGGRSWCGAGAGVGLGALAELGADVDVGNVVGAGVEVGVGLEVEDRVGAIVGAEVGAGLGFGVGAEVWADIGVGAVKQAVFLTVWSYSIFR